MSVSAVAVAGSGSGSKAEFSMRFGTIAAGLSIVVLAVGLAIAGSSLWVADSFKRNGLSRVTKDRARDAGFQIVDLETERRKRGDNVIPFPSHCDETA